MRALGQDVLLAIREITRQRGLSAIVVLTLGLGIGFATALFSVVDGVLLRPLPYVDADRLVYLWQNDRATGTEREPIGSADFYDFRDRTRSFEGVALWGMYSASLLREGVEPLQLGVAVVTADLDRVLGIEPELGRGIGAEEVEGRLGEVVVLTHELWRDGFGADPGAVGTRVVVDGVETEIIGVLPARAAVLMGEGVHAWRPLRLTPASATRSPHAYTAVARLAGGVAVEHAQTEMAALARTLEAEVPENVNRGAFVEPVDRYLRGDARGVMAGLLGAVGVLLVLTVLNVTNLLLARTRARARETAVHTALGAGVARTMRRNLAATTILTLVSAAVGVGVAWATLHAMLGMIPSSLLALGAPTLDGAALGFSVVLALALGVVLGIAPVTSALRLDVRGALGRGRGGDASTGPHRMGRFLVGAQTALATVLLVGSGLLASTLYNLSRVDLGFETDGVLRMSTSLPDNRYPSDFPQYPDWPEKLGFVRETIERVERLPGVLAAALTTNHPLDPGFTNSISIEGRPPDPERGEPTTRMITPGYFEVARVRLLEGRLITEADDHQTDGVVLLNRTAAERYFPAGDAMGARIAFWGLGFREIVGIIEDERVHGLREAAPPAFYTSLLQTPPAGGELTLMVRTAGVPLEWARPVRDAVVAVDPQLAVFNVTSMEATLAGAQQRERFVASLIGVFALMALVLAATGVYGVLSYIVSRRRREMGIRLALVAQPAGLRSMILGQGMWIAGVGVAGGLVLARAAASILEGLLFGVQGGTPAPYALSAAVLLAVAFAASAVPAWRAAAIAPADSLRSE